MKKFIIFFLLAISSMIASAQTSYRLVADRSCFRVSDGYGWSEWSDWMDCGTIVITIDLVEENIRIFTNNIQDYLIVESLGEDYVKGGGKILTLLAVDSEGRTCKVDLVYYYRNGKRSHIYVRFNDVEFGYLLR